MRNPCSQSAAAFAILALLVQVAVAGFGGRVCIQLSSAPVGTGCASRCCSTTEVSGGVGVALVAPHREGVPGQSDCCIEIGAEDIERMADQPNLRTHVPVACATGSTAKVLHQAAPRPSIAANHAAHPPPSTAILRATVLRL